MYWKKIFLNILYYINFNLSLQYNSTKLGDKLSSEAQSWAMRHEDSTVAHKVIEKLGDWRNQENNIPYSEPVIIKDDFGSSEVMVFDRNYITKRQQFTPNGYTLTVQTQWTSEYITVYASIQRVQCGLFAIICTSVAEREEKLIGNKLEVLIDGKSYTVYGNKGQFIVNDDLSRA